jgi:hypothetical protein
LARKQRIEESVEKLKGRKDQMKPEEYEAELERLLVELANVNQEIKARKKHIIRNDADLRETIEYIVLNPVKRGYVSRPQYYPFTAFNFCEEEL